MIATFKGDSPEAIAALRCAHERVVIPGYGVVDRAADDIVEGVHTVTVWFLDDGDSDEIGARR